MARMPQAEWLGEHAPVQQGGGRLSMTRYDIVCVHTIVGHAPAHAAHFSTDGDGTIMQSRDTKYRSGANLEGNHRVISIENEDHGPFFKTWTGSNVPALTAPQVESIAKILAWAHKTHGVPLQLCPNSRPGSRGLAFHRQGIDGNFSNGRVEGGEHWSTSGGKVCPGDNRIKQIPAILKRAKELVNGDDDMNELGPKALAQIRAVVHDELVKAGDVILVDHDGKPTTKKYTLAKMLRSIRNTGRAMLPPKPPTTPKG